MKRTLLSLLLLAIIAVVVIAVLLSRAGDAIKYAVEKYGPLYTETSIQLEKIDFSILGGSATVDQLIVQNPEGFSEGNLLSLGHAHFAIKPTSLLGEVIDIKDITVKNPEFLLETQGLNLTKSNLSKLLDNLQKNTAKAEEESAEKEKTEKKLIVRNLLLEGVKVNLKVGGVSQGITIPTIHLEDVGVDSNGVSPARLSAEILGGVLKGILKAVGDQVLEGKITGTIGDAAKDLTKGLGESADKVLEKSGLKDVGEGVGKALDGVIPGF